LPRHKRVKKFFRNFLHDSKVFYDELLAGDLPLQSIVACCAVALIPLGAPLQLTSKSLELCASGTAFAIR
jgi:hypothetical protein